MFIFKEEGHEIIFITVRNDKECGGKNEAARLTFDWLEKYEIPFSELNVDVHDKKTFCQNNNIDVFMDDSVRTISAVKTLGIPTFLAMNSFNLNYKDDDVTNV